ncbi:hypothetical protein GF327_04265 [Candidatus Woesearchaeota archaeon]|nr:hypothetical protein [Candidatus Woesearchaeota archaeon]
MKQLSKKKLLAALIWIVFCLVSAEFIVRLTLPKFTKIEHKYGWTTCNDECTKTRLIINNSNHEYNITNNFFNHGFKRWDNINSNKTKILILGDSFTEMYTVPNGKEWYSYFEKEFNSIELFVYGCNGFGTIQEYLVLDDYFDIIKPDIILLQFYSSDFSDNLYEFERALYPKINAFRPYLEDGKIIYKQPVIFSSARQISWIVDYLLGIYDKWRLDYNKNHNISPYLEVDQTDLTNYKNKSFFKTLIIINMIINRTKPAPVYFFSADSFTELENDLCAQSGLKCIKGVGELIENKSEQGYHLTPKNDLIHWNELGNELVGKYLSDYFKVHEILK